MSEPHPAKYLTIAEVADVLRLSSWAVRKLCQDGTLPAYKPAGQWLIEADELDAWIKAGRRTSTEAAS